MSILDFSCLKFLQSISNPIENQQYVINDEDLEIEISLEKAQCNAAVSFSSFLSSEEPLPTFIEFTTNDVSIYYTIQTTDDIFLGTF